MRQNMLYKESTLEIPEWILPLNPNSRPGKKRSTNLGVVLHWVANPKTTPIQNAKYWTTLKGKQYGSAHYIIDIAGGILRTLPETEVGYHCGAFNYKEGILEKLSLYPNYTTVGIELCHNDWTGEPSMATYNSAVMLSADILKRWGLTSTALYRHFDVTGKDCPKWFVANPDKWEQFKKDVEVHICL